MRNSWYKIPLYCLIASLVSFQIETGFFGRLAVVHLADGSVTVDHTRWLILCLIEFIAFLLIGGFLFFRKENRRDLFFSASVAATLNFVIGLLLRLSSELPSVYLSQLLNWDSVIPQFLSTLGIRGGIVTVIASLFPSYLFVPFGKKEETEE